LGASLRLGYFAQVRTDLDPEKTVLDTILEVKNLPLGEARNFLARFLFTGDDVFKRISDLSGGEQSRVALAQLVLQRANFLLLDEPTNHLDIASQEVLEHVLDEFTGTIVLVTHDRYLVDRLATQLWIIDPGQQALDLFFGTWAEYAEVQSQEQRDDASQQARDKWSKDQRQMRREERRTRRETEARQQQADQLEVEIHQLEQQLESLQAEIATASAAQEAMRLHELGTIYGELEHQLQDHLERWAELAG
jgi:ATP-binding cassette subfamily F protein 3